jgi:hypothetical protein
MSGLSNLFFDNKRRKTELIFIWKDTRRAGEREQGAGYSFENVSLPW